MFSWHSRLSICIPKQDGPKPTHGRPKLARTIARKVRRTKTGLRLRNSIEDRMIQTPCYLLYIPIMAILNSNPGFQTATLARRPCPVVGWWLLPQPVCAERCCLATGLMQQSATELGVAIKAGRPWPVHSSTTTWTQKKPTTVEYMLRI